jgi:sigma-B regulation protein RsbU (phosphoserine phosphatase)
MAEPMARRVLLVDDNPLFLKVLCHAIQKAGIKCHTCESAAEALAYLAAHQPDLILSDYQMPEMNGLEFRQHILGDDSLKDIPFVFLTYDTDQDVMIKGLDLQAVDYILKNTPVSVIITKINNLLRTVETQRQLSAQELKRAAEALNVRSVPATAPAVEGFALDFWHRSYQDIPGGDFIDFIEIEHRYTFIVLGDIMGKKWTAWFFTFSFLSYLRAAIRFGVSSHDYSTASILQKVNTVICYDDVLKDMMASTALLMLDRQTGRISYSGAGDLPLLKYEAATGQLQQIRSSGLLLGLFADGRYDEQNIELLPNDRLLIFTDGLIDFAGNEGKKTDYQLFAQRLHPLLQQQTSFTELKHTLFNLSVSRQVDDSSIIHIERT